MHVISSILVSGILASSTETVSCPLGIRIGTRTPYYLCNKSCRQKDRWTDRQTDRETDRDVPQLMPVIKRPIMRSSGMLNLTQKTLTAAPRIAGTFDTSTDLFLYADAVSYHNHNHKHICKAP